LQPEPGFGIVVFVRETDKGVSMKNKFAGKCGNCNETVAAGAGTVSKHSNGWIVACADSGCTARGDKFHGVDDTAAKIEAAKATFDARMAPHKVKAEADKAAGADHGNVDESMMAVGEYVWEEIVDEVFGSYAAYIAAIHKAAA
jgi:hypothetical protein